MVNKEKSISFYIKWLFVFVLLMAAIITAGIYVAKRDEQRMAEWKYEFNIIQSIIENLVVYKDEIESWGYQISVVMPDEKPEDEALQYYYRIHCQPVLVLTDAGGGVYCFYYGFDKYTSVASYTDTVHMDTVNMGYDKYVDAQKMVRLELCKLNLYQAPYWENPNEIGERAYYDVEVALDIDTFSLEDGEEISSYDSGYFHTNYCSNNFVDCMFFAEIDPETKNTKQDYHIKKEFSAEQLLAFYQQGLDLQKRLIELYQETCLLTSP